MAHPPLPELVVSRFPSSLVAADGDLSYARASQLNAATLGRPAMFDPETHRNLHTFLAPLRETDWSSWPCSPTGLLETPASFGRRYSTVPPEAVPIIGLGVDGCHYAVWLDDARTLAEDPGVVMVSPMDSYPEQLRWVAPSVEAFRKLLRKDDDWLTRRGSDVVRSRKLAERRRADRVVEMTADGIGVVDEGALTPDALVDDLETAKKVIEGLLARGAAPEALVVARNAIVQHPGRVPGFGLAVAAVYEALNRPDFAEVALHSYEPTSAEPETQARLDALVRQRSN